MRLSKIIDLSRVVSKGIVKFSFLCVSDPCSSFYPSKWTEKCAQVCYSEWQDKNNLSGMSVLQSHMVSSFCTLPDSIYCRPHDFIKPVLFYFSGSKLLRTSRFHVTNQVISPTSIRTYMYMYITLQISPLQEIVKRDNLFTLDNLKSTMRGLMSIRFTLILSLFRRLSVVNIVT